MNGRTIPGYVQAQRAVQDSAFCTQRWPALKQEAGTYSKEEPLRRRLARRCYAPTRSSDSHVPGRLLRRVQRTTPAGAAR